MELKNNPHCAFNFLWLPLERQVRIEGIVQKVDKKTSDEYFSKRPRSSQLGAIASPQSKKLQSREELDQYFQETELKFAPASIITRPEFWGGYLLVPQYFEFWQGRPNRLHDRIVYEWINSSWKKFRLAP
jgi:pyridoxamine 5'-phosphate oxidase